MTTAMRKSTTRRSSAARRAPSCRRPASSTTPARRAAMLPDACLIAFSSSSSWISHLTPSSCPISHVCLSASIGYHQASIPAQPGRHLYQGGDHRGLLCDDQVVSVQGCRA